MTEQGVRRVGGGRLPPTRRLMGAFAAAAVMVLVGVGAYLGLPRLQSSAQSVATAPTFPEIDRSSLTPLQARVADVLEDQWRAQPASATFTEGADEPWCADFVSWVMRESGVALDNPNSGSWRIPGVYTLQEYYQSVGRYQPAENYRPRVGDVVLWGPESPMGLHANIVIGADTETVTTVGGNEGGISVRRSPLALDTHLLGFGRLQ